LISSGVSGAKISTAASRATESRTVAVIKIEESRSKINLNGFLDGGKIDCK
jgi:hypothetical protein